MCTKMCTEIKEFLPMLLIYIGLFAKNGAPGEIRTPDQVVRSHLLYPAELRVHSGGAQFNVSETNI